MKPANVDGAQSLMKIYKTTMAEKSHWDFSYEATKKSDALWERPAVDTRLMWRLSKIWVNETSEIVFNTRPLVFIFTFSPTSLTF